MADTQTTTYSLTKPEIGASDDTWGQKWNDNLDTIDDLLDGTTAIAPNLTAGSWEVSGVAVTSTAAELNILDGVTSTTAELNILDGVTSTAAELNILDGVTATTAELNIMDGVTATTAEINYVDGVTSNVQTQLDGKVVTSDANEYTKTQNFNGTTLTFDATQDWNLQTNQVTTLTLTANTTFDAPTNMVDGAFYHITIKQNGTGGYTVAWNAVFKFPAGTAPTITSTASAIDELTFKSDGTNMYLVSLNQNLS